MDDEISTGKSDALFCTTRWSLISEARSPDATNAHSTLNSLIKDYWKPIYCCIRKKGIPEDKAKDLTQDFFYTILYEKKLFAKADKSQGRFRTFLLTALNNYLVSQYRYAQAKKRIENREIFNSELLENLENSDAFNAMPEDQAFSYTWIAALLENTAASVMQHFCSHGKQLHWRLFSRRIWEPILCRTEAPSLAQLTSEYALKDEAAASNMITTVKRAFRKALRMRIREYVYTDSDVDDELADFMAFLRKKSQDSG